MKDAAVAEDVVQDAFVRALGAFEQFRGEIRGRGCCRSSGTLRSMQSSGVGVMPPERFPAHAITKGADAGDPLLQIPDSSDDPEAALARSQDGRALDTLLAALPADLRECIVLRELEDLSYKEISEITGSPIGTVMSRLWRARRSLAAAATGSPP